MVGPGWSRNPRAFPRALSQQDQWGPRVAAPDGQPPEWRGFITMPSAIADHELERLSALKQTSGGRRLLRRRSARQSEAKDQCAGVVTRACGVEVDPAQRLDCQISGATSTSASCSTAPIALFYLQLRAGKGGMRRREPAFSRARRRPAMTSRSSSSSSIHNFAARIDGRSEGGGRLKVAVPARRRRQHGRGLSRPRGLRRQISTAVFEASGTAN